MSKISAIKVADSKCNDHRITTMLLTYPRFIHSEMCRHRMFSRNTASSRAIPFKKMVEVIKNDPFIPIAWQKDHSGMQGVEYFTSGIGDVEDNWLRARDAAVDRANEMHLRGVTKQLCNRLLEPWMWTVELVTFTESENFFHLRCPVYEVDLTKMRAPGTPTGFGEKKTFRSRKDVKAYLGQPWVNGVAAILPADDTDLYWLQQNKGQAEIHMMALAEAMWDQFQSSTPKELKSGEWHMPYGPSVSEIGDHLYSTLTSDLAANTKAITDVQLAVATARCAQTSYTVVGDGEKSMTYENLIDLHNSLLVRPYANRKGVVFGPDDPIHASPAEHCAQAMTDEEYMRYGHAKPYENPIQASTSQVEYGWCHNLRGFKSYRSMIPNENRR